MKKMIKFAVCCLGIITFVACGYSVKGNNGKSYSDYKEACADNEFEAARQLLEKKEPKEKGNSRKERRKYYKECEDYNNGLFEVFEKESSYLANLNEEQSTKRLLYLIKEEEGTEIGGDRDFHKHLSKLMSLGVALDNVDLVRGIYKLSGIDVKPGIDVIEFMAKQNTDEDNLLVIMHDKMQYDHYDLSSGEALNHIDIALLVNNIDLAKGLMDFLKPEDKAIAAKKLKKTK